MFLDSYGITFALEELKTKKHLDNVKINLIADWKEIYKNRFKKRPNNKLNGFNEGTERFWQRQIKDIEKIINSRLKVDVKLENDEIVFVISPRKGKINTKSYVHNLTNEFSTFLELNHNYTSFMYWSNDSIPVDSQALVSKSNNWNFKTILNKNKDKIYKFDVNEKITKSNDNDIFKMLRKRSFGNRDGSLWAIAKVNDDPNDNRYYVGTNKHVPLLKNTTIVIPKIHENENDISSIFNKDKNWNLKSELFWEASENKIIDGNNLTEDNKNGADLQVGIIDISEFISYYENNKNKADKENDINFLISKHFYQWKDLKPIKISQKIKHIKINQIFDSYIVAFPNDKDQVLGKLAQDSSYFYRKNVQLKMKFGDLWAISNNFGYEVSDNIGMHHEINGIWDSKINNLVDGSSGSAVYDDEGNLYGIHMGVFNNLWQTVLISSPRLDLFGHYDEFNTKSLASRVQLANRLYPDKYKKIETFENFDNPLINQKAQDNKTT
ncbi:hypothetical protein [Mycoplasmopsis pulmonis]|uniref:hypothetical protein n=1 Tax=Mycoplasmopsis pulmonis TaxID=2107 RepID=UPI0010052096|nr:hypothetical protein [Mycoplasmopsis pulmonis]VEU68230.1 Uncharacterised protein [Mycoplasmopsis pulmonis]